MLTKLQFRPGINRETTDYTNSGGWVDGNKIRFRFGLPESIGGWEKLSNAPLLGQCVALHTWTALNNDIYTGAGTNLKYYIVDGGSPNDITPIDVHDAVADLFHTGEEEFELVREVPLHRLAIVAHHR